MITVRLLVTKFLINLARKICPHHRVYYNSGIVTCVLCKIDRTDFSDKELDTILHKLDPVNDWFGD